ncbi:DUF5011 domain-containing protein [Listeria welshimeri]|nr:DUF5011 domain-containing protein [Listeria welshimeri]
MSEMDKQTNGKRPSKMVVGIGLAAMLVVGGGIGTGFYLHSDASTPESKSETKVKQASNDQKKPRKSSKDKSSKKDHANKDDILGTILGKQETENSQVAAILDGPAQTSKEKTMQARTVALAAMANLPTELPATTLEKPATTSPGNTDLRVVEDPIKPIVPDNPNVVPGGDIPLVPEPVVPTPTPIPDEVPPTPNPTPANTAPQLMADNQVIHIGGHFNPYDYVSASDAEDGDLTSSVQVISNNVNPDKEGVYSVTYRVTDSGGKTAERSITIEIINDAPVLHVDDSQLSVGDNFNPMKGVSASDTEDGDVTSRVEVIQNNVDTTKAGTYQVTYQVTDSYGKATTKTIQVTVMNDNPVIVASDQEIMVGDTFQPLAGVTASDKQDGDLTSKIQVQSNDVDTTKAGTYHVTYTVEDLNGAKTEKTVTITVKEENQAPEIRMDTNTIHLHVGDQPDWMVGVTAMDKEDGNLTNKVTVDVSKVNLTTPGNYTVTYQVTDSKGATTTKEVTVIVE